MVPAWAYLNVTVANMFNATAAQALAETGDSTSSSSELPVPTNTGSSSSSDTITSPTTTASPNGGHKSDIGAIVGGVVGGVLGLVVLALLGYLGWRRHLQTVASSSGPADQSVDTENLTRTPDPEKLATSDVPPSPNPAGALFVPELLAHPPKLYVSSSQ